MADIILTDAEDKNSTTTEIKQEEGSSWIGKGLLVTGLMALGVGSTVLYMSMRNGQGAADTAKETISNICRVLNCR